jgi:hypothetical protein
MKRRDLLASGIVGLGFALASQGPIEERATIPTRRRRGVITKVSSQQPTEETAIASATFDATPRVAVVLSSFRGSSEHDGTPIAGLPDPRPIDADLDFAHIDAMVRKALELGAQRQGGLASIVGPEDWVVIKPAIPSCFGLSREWTPGTVTDLRAIQSVMSFLIEHGCGKRITIAEGPADWLPMEKSGKPVDGWTTDWGGTFDGLSYKKMIEGFSRRHPAIRFELLDLNFADFMEVPVSRRVLSATHAPRTYFVPKAIQQCDKLVSMAPLKTDRMTCVSLSVKNYFGIAPGVKYGFPKRGLEKMGDPNEVMVELFSFHPADYAILGGSWGIGAGESSVAVPVSVHHNVIVAGANAVGVDAVGTAIMGFNPAKLPYLRNLARKGFGPANIDAIWTRGNEIEEARRDFRQLGGQQSPQGKD